MSANPEKILLSINSQWHKKPLVESSAVTDERVKADRARKLGEAVRRKGELTAQGSPAEKVGSFLLKAKKIEDSKRKRELLAGIIKERLVVQPEDIPQSYWVRQDQIARDNGSPIDLDEYSKGMLVERLQDAQVEGANSWVDYLSNIGDLYPTWFKAYALDGMTGLGVFDKSKGVYAKRDKGTVAPYPTLIPAALAKTYDALYDFHGKGVPSDDKNEDSLVRGGNFNKIYSHFLLEVKAIVPTPERSENVHGEWRVYTEHDIPALTHAAEGTPWCIAGEQEAKHYTEDGGEFYLFHLHDSETGVASPTAAASIRMDKGRVAEISGLKGGSKQFLEDSLVPEVMDKVNTLPGGERYLQAFGDKQVLISMDKKYQAGEPFTIDELRFLYELDRKISYIDTYSNDPRPIEFKNNKAEHQQQLADAYGQQAADWMVMETDEVGKNLFNLLKSGTPADHLVSKLKSYDIVANFEILLAHGADINNVVRQLESEDVESNLNTLLTAGANADAIVRQLSPASVMYNRDILRAAGANIDVNVLVTQFRPEDVKYDLDALLAAGADIDIVMKQLRPDGALYNLDALRAAGAQVDVNTILRQSDSWHIVHNLRKLIEAGAGIDTIVRQLEPKTIASNLNTLLAAGADVNALMNQLEPPNVVSNLDTLRAAGANIDVNALMHQLESEDIESNLNTLLAAGAEVNVVVPKLSSKGVVRYLDTLRAAGANIDVNALMHQLESYDIRHNLNTLIAAGADVNALVNLLEPREIASGLNILLAAGANIDINAVVSKLDPRGVMYNRDILLAAGANIDINALVRQLESEDITLYLGKLLAAGAEVNALVNQLEPGDIDDNLDTLLAAGADVHVVVSKLSSMGVGHNLDTLLAAGADVSALVNQLEPGEIGDYLGKLLAAGANIDVNALVALLDPISLIFSSNNLLAAGVTMEQIRARLNLG